MMLFARAMAEAMPWTPPMRCAKDEKALSSGANSRASNSASVFGVEMFCNDRVNI